MGKFRIELAPAGSRDLDDLEIGMVTKIVSGLRNLGEDPFPKGKLMKKIKGKQTAFYRLRVDKVRVFFEIQPGKMVILRILSKKSRSAYQEVLESGIRDTSLTSSRGRRTIFGPFLDLVHSP